MLYNWVPEQQEVRDRVKAFCEEHVVPFSQQWDRRPPEFPEEIFQKMAKEGFVGFPRAKGAIKGAFALPEPEAGSDAASQRTTALDKGDHYLVNGEKIFITSGNVADAIVVIVRIMESEAR